MIKAALLFLVVIMALALFGRFRVGRSRGNRPGAKSGSGSATKLPAQRCTACGRFLFDRAPCPCGGKARP